MSKLDIKFNRLTPFKRCVLQNFPFIEEDFDALTNYGLLCKVVKYLNKIIDSQNEVQGVTEEIVTAFNNLYDYVKNYFDNLDVQEEIDNKLDEMTESGELASIIGEYINEGFLNDNFYIYPKRKGRYLAKTTANPDYDSTVDFPVMQGGCYVGNNHFIQARLVDSNTNRTQLQEINLETGEVIRTNILQLQHANSITYDPNTNRLYICSLTLSGVNTQYIYVLDYTTWNIIKTIDLSSQLEATEGTHSISYDEKTGKFILGAELKTYNSMRFFELDVDTEELTEITMTDSYGLLSGTGANNDITVYNNHLYLLKHRPNCISEWDLTTGKLIKVYNIPLITPEGWTQGEGENITYSPTEGVFYFAAYSPDCNGGYYSINSFYTFDLKHNQPIIPKFTVVADLVKTAYVDVDSTAWNPTGENWAKGFATIGEALQLLNLPEVAGLSVNIRKDKTYPYVNIYSEKVVTISGSDVNDYANTIVNGISIEDSNSVYITAVNIRGNGSHTYDVRLRRSKAEITSVLLSGNVAEHIDTWHSTITFYFMRYDTGVTGDMFRCRAENSLICLDTIPEYNVVGTKPTINKPVRVALCSSLTSTPQDFPITNKDFLALSDELWLHVSGLYYQNGTFISTQTNQGGNRNFTVILDNVMCEFQIVFDYTNSKLTCKLTKAINLETGADVTSATTGIGVAVYIYK